MATKKSILILQLLKELLDGKKITTEDFALRNDIDVRTVQRYIKDIKEVFEKNFLKENETYSFITSSIFENNILNFDKKELEIFVDLYSLLHFDFSSRFGIGQNLLKKMKKNYSQIYEIKQNPFEQITSNKELFFDIKTAIKHKRYTQIEYESDKKYVIEDAKIIKIVFSQGNFYLAILTNEETNNGFKFLRLNFVNKIKLYQKSFQKDVEIEQFLKNFQTLFSLYKEKSYEVVLQINSSVKRFFLQKKFLSSQKIIENKDDLIVSFEVTNDMEILPLVKKWLPNIKIISPQSTKNKLNKELINYLS